MATAAEGVAPDGAGAPDQAIAPAVSAAVMGQQSFHLGGLTFFANPMARRLTVPPGTPVLYKSERTIEYYRELALRRPRHVLELGMRDGGAMLLWDKLFVPEVLVGLDMRSEPIALLEEYRAERPHIRSYYGRNPHKPGAVMAARQNFGRAGPDLIIDDASHRYEETRQAFENLFPLLRAGGTYVIEGWNWAHKPGAQDEGHPGWARPSLATLAFELSLLAATSRAIEQVLVKEGFFAVRKGEGSLPEGGIAAGLPLRGRAGFDL